MGCVLEGTFGTPTHPPNFLCKVLGQNSLFEQFFRDKNAGFLYKFCSYPEKIFSYLEKICSYAVFKTKCWKMVKMQTKNPATAPSSNNNLN